ncbi:Omp28-related outer membrane protein [bacterium SCSIO 12741]|nr:Omp28-related outer membrane protein [bacterium SCSIO 12741]
MMKKWTFLLALLPLSLFAQAQHTKVVLVEEGTGTWCQWCPRGDVYGIEMHKQYPKTAIYISVHDGDPMEMPDYADQLNLSGYPNGRIDRNTTTGLQPGALSSDLAPYLSQTPIAGVSSDITFNSTTRELTMTIEAEMGKDATGSYRLGAIVVENGMIGPSPRYDQSNSYSGGNFGTMGGYEKLPSPVPAGRMVYNHVARHLPGGFSGDSLSLPSQLDSAQTYTYVYKWTLPAEVNEDLIQVVGFMIDMSNGYMVNAGKSTYLSGKDNAAPFFHSDARTKGFKSLVYNYEVITHDPDADGITLSVASGPAWLSLTDNGDGTADLKGTPPSVGSFPVTIEVTDGQETTQQTYTLIVEEPTVDWVQVGKVGFSGNSGSSIDLEFDKNNVAYAFMSNSDNDFGQVYSFANNQWSQVGQNYSDINPFQCDFTIDPEGTPYVVNENTLKKWNGSQWETVGNGPFHSARVISPQVVIGLDGHPIVVGMETSGTSVSYQFDGSSWVSRGPVADGITVWYRLKTDLNGVITTIYGTDGSNSFYSEAARFTGSGWETYKGHVDGNDFTYFDHDIATTPKGDAYAALILGFSDQFLNIYKYDKGDETWKLIKANLSDGPAEDCMIESDINGTITVSYVDKNAGSKMSVQRLQNGNWEYLGIQGFTPGVAQANMTLNDAGIPFVLYSDVSAGEKLSVKRFEDFATVSVNDVSEKSSQNWRIFPNPNNGNFSLEGPHAERYELVDMTGRIHRANELNSTVDIQSVNLGSLKPGIYWIRLYSAQGNQTQSILIK